MKKHILDWYIENTPQNDKEYEDSFVGCFAIIGIVFFVVIITILLFDYFGLIEI